jgi:phosphoenolpyruvate carboxylase
LALTQFIFLRAVQIPAFSRANDISRDEVLQMVFSLRIDDALAQLRRAYPVSAPSLDDYSVTEPADYPDLTGHSYAAIREELIDPIEEAYTLCLRVSVAIANYFGGHG